MFYLRKLVHIWQIRLLKTIFATLDEQWRGGKYNTWSARRGGPGLSEATIYAPLYIFLCFARFHTFDAIYALFYILPASNCGDTFYSPIYIGTDSFGINYKLHELGFEYGFSG